MAEAGRKKGAGFFAVHRRTWARICDAGSLNEAAAYLVLAQGTGRDNRSTSWSATSLQRYVGISWARGKLAVEGLTSKGFIRRADNSTTERPRYELRSHAELALSDYERSVVDRLRGDKEMVLTGTIKHRLRELEERRIVARQPDGSYRAVDATNPEDLIWLPNTLITGTEAGEDPPVRRLRSAGDLWTLRLLIDLYHAQNLRDDGGISIKLLRQKYERMKVGEQGIFNVWAFKPGTETAWFSGCLEAHQQRPRDTDGNHPIWQSTGHLRRDGLVTYVAHLWENDTDSAEIIHSYGIDGVAEPLEVSVGEVAHEAALAMVPEFKTEKAIGDGYRYFAPVKNTLPNVQMIGVARLRYRPHTTRTSSWFGNLYKEGPAWIQRYREWEKNAARKIA